MPYTYEYPRPAATADTIVVAEAQVLLVQRKYPPYQNSYALPGGFLDEWEQSVEPGDDARCATWFLLQKKRPSLTFDHTQIMQDYLKTR